MAEIDNQELKTFLGKDLNLFGVVHLFHEQILSGLDEKGPLEGTLVKVRKPIAISSLFPLERWL